MCLTKMVSLTQHILLFRGGLLNINSSSLPPLALFQLFRNNNRVAHLEPLLDMTQKWLDQLALGWALTVDHLPHPQATSHQQGLDRVDHPFYQVALVHPISPRQDLTADLRRINLTNRILLHLPRLNSRAHRDNNNIRVHNNSNNNNRDHSRAFTHNNPRHRLRHRHHHRNNLWNLTTPSITLQLLKSVLPLNLKLTKNSLKYFIPTRKNSVGSKKCWTKCLVCLQIIQTC
mmetsp:Transcript_768/g.1081  ORF Transcript_768/g.1081 Transcript_768/m.1081 type:complete len:231 (+) Transcript_768:1090-1782(+)